MSAGRMRARSLGRRIHVRPCFRTTARCTPGNGAVASAYPAAPRSGAECRLAPSPPARHAAAVPPPAAQGPIRAARTPGPRSWTGGPDDPVWQLAPPTPSSWSSSRTRAAAVPARVPHRGPGAPRRPDALHPGGLPRSAARARPSQLGAARLAPGRRQVEIVIDSTHDRRSGYYFGVNAAGVLRDGLLYGDVNLADTWDGVWDAAVAASSRTGGAPSSPSRSTSCASPARPPRSGASSSGAPSTGPTRSSTRPLVPRSANGLVSRFGTLDRAGRVVPHRAFELTPYATARLTSPAAVHRTPRTPRPG